MESTAYQVKVGKLPGTIKEVMITEGTTVDQVLSQADLDPEGFEIRVNGDPSELNNAVSPGDTVLLVRKIQGNLLI